MRVTVFGGTGFLGRRIVADLVARGLDTRTAVRRVDRSRPGDGVEAVSADIRSDDAVRAAVADADAVINAVSLYVEHRDLTFDAIHVDGAARVARLAREAGVERLLHLSGIGADPASTSAYVRARARGEAAVRAAFPGATLLRPSVLFGPRDSFVATLDGLTRLPAIPLFGRGRTRLQPAFVDDVAAAAVTAVCTGEAEGSIYELGGSEVLTYRETVEAVLRARARHRPLVPVPFAAWHGIAALGAVLPNPPLTRDQVRLMETDNVVPAGAPGFAALRISPAGFRERLPECLPGAG